MRKCYKTLSLISYKIPNFIRYSVFFNLASCPSSYTEKHPRNNKDSNPPIPPSTENGRKSHRYEKKTVFDIMGVVYEYDGLRRQKKAASFLKMMPIYVYLACSFLREKVFQEFF